MNTWPKTKCPDCGTNVYFKDNQTTVSMCSCGFLLLHPNYQNAQVSMINGFICPVCEDTGLIILPVTTGNVKTTSIVRCLCNAGDKHYKCIPTVNERWKIKDLHDRRLKILNIFEK